MNSVIDSVIEEKIDDSTKENDSSRKNSKAEMLIIGDVNLNNDGNLQNSFLKFRDQKIKERQIMKMSQKNLLENGRTQEFKDNLRNKFIEQAKRYLGVPYAERFKAPDAPVAPLYLDCCGLVRQVLLDLKEEFGFVIGRWNQAYQMDTLPIILDQSELKPGDLIFYEGEYYSNRSKPQKHNNVHVEIYLGGDSGEATIASRYHRGVVSIFPSFKFDSTTWKLVKFHFRSLETWLDGICKSCCLDHAWQSDSLAYLETAGKRSIFSDETLDDVNAGGEEEDQDEPICQSCEKVESLPREPEKGNQCQSEENNDESQTPPPAPSANEANSLSIKGPSKKPKRVSQYKNDTSKSLDSLDSIKVKGGVSSKSEKEKCHSNTYYVGKSNGWKLVKDALDKRGWQQLPFEYQFSSRFGLKWVERRSQIDYRSHIPGQLVCHIPNNDVITTKVGLLTTLRDKFCKQAPGSSKIIHSPWLPNTYDLDIPADINALISTAESFVGSENEPLWIYKPSANNRGRGIKVVTGIEALRMICHGKPTSDPETNIPPMKGIVQKYIENPLLIGPEGFKFDIRCYMLIARNTPTTIAYYHPGYCRLAMKPYTLSRNKGSLDDIMMHLTNASIQKKDPTYQNNKDLQIQSLATVAEKMATNGKESSQDYILNKLDHDIKRCMVDVLKASNNKFLKKHGYFDLLGCDFMLTDDNQLYLLEINTNPALSRDNSVLEELLPQVVDGAIDLVLRSQGPDADIDSDTSSLSQDLPFNYQVIFDEAKNWMYGQS